MTSITTAWKAVALALLAGSAACASRPAGPVVRTPTDVVRAQIRALQAGDEAAAAAWLTPDAQARAALWPAADDRPGLDRVDEVARVARWDGSVPLEVVRGPSGWQIRLGVLGLAHADTPERALDAFGRAIVARDWTMIHDLLPSDQKAAWSAANLGAALGVGARADRWRALGEALAAARYAVVAKDPERVKARVELATVPTEVVVGREGAGWKVFDVTPRSEYIAP